MSKSDSDVQKLEKGGMKVDLSHLRVFSTHSHIIYRPVPCCRLCGRGEIHSVTGCSFLELFPGGTISEKISPCSFHLRLLWYECGHVLILQASVNTAFSCVSIPCASILSVCRTILTRCTTSPGTPQDCFLIQLSRRHPGMAFLLLVPLLLMFSMCSSQGNRQLACHGCCLYRPHSQAEHMPPKPHMAGRVQGEILSTALKRCVDNWC